MPRVKRKRSTEIQKMPKGFYLKKGIWYKRVYKPDPVTGVWALRAESTHCKDSEPQAPMDYVATRNEELEKSVRLRKAVDPGKVTVDELFDDLLSNTAHEPTRENYEWVLQTHVRPFFGHMLAADVTVSDCQAFRAHRRK